MTSSRLAARHVRTWVCKPAQTPPPRRAKIAVKNCEALMTGIRAVTIASVALALGAVPLSAQELSRYRGYALESNVATVAKLAGARDSDVRTTYRRPARIQQLEWRAPYVFSGTDHADPVHDIQFSFLDDQLYRVVVSYVRERMEGLTIDDLVQSLAATYGPPSSSPVAGARGTPRIDMLDETIVVARWENAGSLLSLTRTVYSPQFQLVLVSKPLMARAGAAIKEALRLDTVEAPQRALDQIKQAAADADVASEKARVLNKPAFRP